MTSKDNSFFFSHPDPIVQALLNTELIPENLINTLSNPLIIKNPKAQAITMLLLADAGIKSIEEANKFAESVYLTPCHVDLQIIFLAIWYGIIVEDIVPIAQMKAIHATMIGLITNETIPEIRSIVHMVQGRHAAYLGDFVTHLRLADSALNGINPTSPLYKKLWILKAMAFFGHGMGTHVQNIIGEKNLPSWDKIGLYISQLCNSALTGDFKNVDTILELLGKTPNHKFLNINSLGIEMSCSLISMISRFYHLPIPSPIVIEKSNEKKNWARSTQALLENKTEEALHWARLSADEITTRIGEPLNFIEYILIRAELASGNGSGAKRLLLQLRQKGTETFIDNFFFARAELLLGNQDTAVTHFANLKTSINKYAADKRFDFEVALACELRPSVLLNLSTQAIKISNQQFEIPIDYSPQPKGLVAIVSISSKIEQIKESIQRYADLNFPVLITGETGTGKELVARALHETSKRSDKQFVAINCSSVTDTLIESEFFGHAPGAFTGAQTAYKGIFREAGEGTVFLDEIADISPQLQVSLLRVLETGEIKPVESSNPHEIKCRVVVATNQSLLELVDKGKFRKDLFYRLQRLEINLPPLKDRPEDIEKLARYFFESDRDPQMKVILTEELIKTLNLYSWPGNVRELRNIIQRVRILSSDKLHYDLSDFDRCGCIITDNNYPIQTFPTENETQLFLNEKNSTFRRKKRLRELFLEHGELRVSEAARLLEVTPYTITRYMVELTKEGVIEKITPNASPNSHYYTRKKK